MSEDRNEPHEYAHKEASQIARVHVGDEVLLTASIPTFPAEKGVHRFRFEFTIDTESGRLARIVVGVTKDPATGAFQVVTPVEMETEVLGQLVAWHKWTRDPVSGEWIADVIPLQMELFGQFGSLKAPKLYDNEDA